MQLKTIDTAIGMVFLYLLLTFVASAILEVIARALNWRAKNLHDALGVLLADSRILTPTDVYRSPLVVALSRDARSIPRWDILERMGWRERRELAPPSYIPPATFSAVVLESMISLAAARAWAGGPSEQDRKAPDLSPEGSVEAARVVVRRYSLDGTPEALISVVKTTLATQGSSVQ